VSVTPTEALAEGRFLVITNNTDSNSVDATIAITISIIPVKKIFMYFNIIFFFLLNLNAYINTRRLSYNTVAAAPDINKFAQARHDLQCLDR